MSKRVELATKTQISRVNMNINDTFHAKTSSIQNWIEIHLLHEICCESIRVSAVFENKINHNAPIFVV